MRTLVFWGGGRIEEARRHAESGATLVAWTPAAAATLAGSGIACAPDLDGEDADRVDGAAIAWTKAWGARPLRDGVPFRDLIAWKGVSLWWFAELYLHYSTDAPWLVRAIERAQLLLERHAPEEVEIAGVPAAEAVVLARTCTAKGVLCHATARAPSAPLARRTLRVRLAARWNDVKGLASALKASLAAAPATPARDSRAVALFLSHAAFWRTRRIPETDAAEEYEHYFDRLIPESAADPRLQPFVVAVGPRAAFRRRGPSQRLAEWLRLHPGSGPYVHVNAYSRARVLREVRRATRQIRALWRELTGSAGLRDLFAHRGVAFHDLCGPDFAATLLLQLPWAVRCYEEMAAVLAAVRPQVVCLYAESSGWGRAALAACRAAGVPTVAIQHGILYPKYYSYLHGPDEAACPRPDRTALFGEAARRFLVESGGYAPDSLVLTGSPKFDDLLRTAASWDRDAARARLGAGPEERLVVVASRHKAIRASHQSIGSAFPALVRAIEGLAGVRCVVKPHPAEPADAYDADLRAAGATRTRVAPATAGLTELLHAADALVTVESLSAIEALVLDRPVLILNMPTNLRELVDRGVAAGCARGDDPTDVLKDLLFGTETPARLAHARREYVDDVAHGADGGATARIVALLRQTAEARGMVGL